MDGMENVIVVYGKKYPTFDRKAFCERLKWAIKERHITPYALSKRILFSPESIWNWTSGRRIPNAQALALMSQVLDISVDFLLFGKD